MPICTMLCISQKGSRCDPNPKHKSLHTELSTVTYRDCDTKGSRCNPNSNPVYKELSTATYRDCDTKGYRCNLNPNPVYKELSTVTYRDCDTKGSRCNLYPNPVYKDLSNMTIGIVTQRAWCTTGLLHIGPSGIKGMLQKGQTRECAYNTDEET